MSVWNYLLTEASLPLEGGSGLPRLSRKLQDSEGSSPGNVSTHCAQEKRRSSVEVLASCAGSCRDAACMSRHPC